MTLDILFNSNTGGALGSISLLLSMIAKIDLMALLPLAISEVILPASAMFLPVLIKMKKVLDY